MKAVSTISVEPKKIRWSLSSVVLTAFALLFLFPIGYGIFLSLIPFDAYTTGDIRFSLENYAYAFTEMNFPLYLFNTAVVSIAVTVLSLTVSVCAAYAFSRIEFKGREFLFWLVVATLMVPGHISLIPNYLNMAKVGLLDSYWTLILPSIASGFVTFFLRQYFKNIPKAMDEAAWIDGATHLQVLWKVIVPMARPAIAAMALFTFLGEWNSYIWPLISTDSEEVRTLQIALSRLYAGAADDGIVNWPLVMAGATLTMLPTLLCFKLVEKHLVRGIAMGALK
ncbi:glycerol-3-phosphate ABC transporter permease [Vibrio sp. 10N.286.49.C2]|uniref:carbohydrate ABC transporter permease n=1 Tax=unclassified Vibrio TaxID=2614977 RepID=UPI000C8386A7|nr:MULTISPECIES: carbohydrate ABC transporter permease [unclassified Vibrio]PMH33912.1 glycerol-3-phosphate ABC transporter permease [Vibrio sp. 10N.286.49.C2]PMH44170.1 glycerol-3-phosphate ABC transporter permease [Vibrio sp. 10N.286.49.B1]PMH82378.1 glycerol-3-phosphate ABC transporter permease [Vibrio sp. 10N.286.48.B7]